MGGDGGYGLAEGELSRLVVGLSIVAMPLERAVSVAGRANPAIEFIAREERGLVVVLSSRVDDVDDARAASFLHKLAEHHGLAIEFLDHDDARRAMLAGPQLRERMAAATVLHGQLERSFPDRSGHGRDAGQPLGRLHASLRAPSRRMLSRLASEHGLESIKLFGSAARSDFRPDSDVDVVVRYRPDRRPTLRSTIELERALERAFNRDVDVVREENLRPEVADAIRAEELALL